MKTHDTFHEANLCSLTVAELSQLERHWLDVAASYGYMGLTFLERHERASAYHKAELARYARERKTRR